MDLSGSIPLPVHVEEMLSALCIAQGLPPPDAGARGLLARIGEQNSLQILREISTAKVRNLSGFILFMAKKFNETGIQESASPAAPACSSSMTSPVKRDETSASSSSSETSSRQMTSPQLAALGELDFKKAFLILSYLGKSRLEDMLSVDMINKLKLLPGASFESEIWKAFGHRSLSESDRRVSLDWDSSKTHAYYCYVDPAGNFTFKRIVELLYSSLDQKLEQAGSVMFDEGPYLQTTRNHLQRVLGDDNVLIVKFAEETEVRKSAHMLDNLSAVYHKIASEGILVGLRRYNFFVFKDGGKEEKKKSPTSSAVKCFFVCIPSHKSIHEARCNFMHIHTVPSMAKYMARFSLILSKTIMLAVDLSTVEIKCIEDIPCKNDIGDPIYSQDGEMMIMTDGTGFISEDLAAKCPRNIYKGDHLIPTYIQEKSGQVMLKDVVVPKRLPDRLEFEDIRLHSMQSQFLTCEPPLLIQFRLFNNGCAVKGTLLVNKRLPPSTIHIRPSMIKVVADPNISTSLSANSLEIVATSNQPKKACLSKSLIALLHYGGVPRDYFLELLTNTLNDAQNAGASKKAALRVALKYGEMDDFIVSRMILCGIPLDEPYLQYYLSVLMKEERKGLKGGKLPINECYYLMGTADPTGTLKANEVCVILQNGHVSGKVLVYKHPGLHFGDIHVLNATYIKDLDKIVGNSKYAIFFPTKGPRSVADEIANSDLDGDMYWISRNPQLLEYFTASDPWFRSSSKIKINQPKPSQYFAEELESQLFEQFLVNRFKPSYTVSAASDSWLAFIDRLLTLGDDCSEEKQCLRKKILQLIDIYYDALDAPKSGMKVNVLSELKAEKFPHFMEKSNSYHSTSILGLIYDTVDSYQNVDLPTKDVWKVSCFSSQVSQPLLRLWKKRYDEYRREMKLALDSESKDSSANEVVQKYKWMLYEAAELEESTKETEVIYEEALAIYQVTYDYAMAVREVKRCGFAWKVAARALCKLYVIKQDGDSSIVCSRAVLREVLG